MLDYKVALAEIAEQDRKVQAAFDAEIQAYILEDEQDTSHREAEAARMDTHNTEFLSLATDPRWDWATPDWNDALDDKMMSQRCTEIRAALCEVAGKKPPRDILRHIEKLLNCSFSHRIKTHIVEMVAGRETIEGACKHCFGIYQEDSRNETLSDPMAIWQTLSSILNTAPVFYAFLERAWHLNPTSAYFPARYRDIVTAVRDRDQHHHDSPPYANPYRQMEALNETLKEIAYRIRHTSDPTELAKLANAQVKQIGALHIISEKLARQAAEKITDAKKQALTG